MDPHGVVNMTNLPQDMRDRLVDEKKQAHELKEMKEGMSKSALDEMKFKNPTLYAQLKPYLNEEGSVNFDSIPDSLWE